MCTPPMHTHYRRPIENAFECLIGVLADNWDEWQSLIRVVAAVAVVVIAIAEIAGVDDFVSD